MDINLENLLCAIAGILTTSCFIPQTIKVIKTRKTQGISFFMYLLFVIGVTFWLMAGIVMKNYPIIIANAITFTLAIIILFIKTKNLLSNKE